MFEIIMLFAFLGASFCQLLPDRSTATGPPLDQQQRIDKTAKALSHRPAGQRQDLPGQPAERKGRKVHYTLAA